MNSVFFKSVLMQPPIIMGVQLRPFSALHALTLAQFDNAYATGANIDVHDVIQAIEICRDGFDDNCRHLEKFHGSRIYRGAWMIRSARFNLKTAQSDLIAHTKAYTTYPGVWREKGKTGHSGIPWQFKIVAQLMSNYHMTESAAWDMALDRAFCYLSNISENGGSEVMSQDALDISEWQHSEVADEIESLEEYRKWRESRGRSTQ